MLRNISKIIAILGIFASYTAYADDTPIITGSVSPFKVCLQPKTGATGEEWSVNEGYVTQDQANLLQQQQPVCFDQTLSITDFNNLTAFEKDAFTAAAIWQSYIQIESPVEIDLYADNSQARFGATFINGQQIPHTFTIAGRQQKFTELQPEALSIATHPAAPNAVKPIIQVLLNEEFGYKYYCFDSAPTNNAPSQCTINKGEWDVTSVLQHELGHGYGIISARSRDTTNLTNYGDFVGNWVNTFDLYTNNVINNGQATYNFAKPYQTYYANNQHYLLFTGTKTQEYLASLGYYPPANASGTLEPQGAPIANFQLTNDNSSQNFCHFGINDVHPVSNVINDDLMGLWLNWDASQGQRLEISTLDLKVLEDMGYPMITDTERSDPRDIFASTDAN